MPITAAAKPTPHQERHIGHSLRVSHCHTDRRGHRSLRVWQQQTLIARPRTSALRSAKRPMCHAEAPADLWRHSQRGVAQNDRSGFCPQSNRSPVCLCSYGRQPPPGAQKAACEPWQKPWKITLFVRMLGVKGYKIPIMIENTQSIYTTDCKILQEEFVQLLAKIFSHFKGHFSDPKYDNFPAYRADTERICLFDRPRT